MGPNPRSVPDKGNVNAILSGDNTPDFFIFSGGWAYSVFAISDKIVL